MRRILVYSLIGLAMIGLGSQLLFRPSHLFKTLLIIGLGAVLIYFIYQFFYRRRYNSAEMRKYRQAAKQSRLKYQDHGKLKTSRKSQGKPLRRRASHLRVIDGNKQK